MIRRSYFPDNLGVTVCLYPRSGSEKGNPAFFKYNTDIISGWHKLLNKDPSKLIIWDYFNYPNRGLEVPTEYPHAIAKFIRFMKGRALGLFIDGLNPRDGAAYFQTYYTGWITHKLLWNPDLDPDQLRKEYCHDLFGLAAKEMLAFYKSLEDHWEKVTWKKPRTLHSPDLDRLQRKLPARGNRRV